MPGHAGPALAEILQQLGIVGLVAGCKRRPARAPRTARARLSPRRCLCHPSPRSRRGPSRVMAQGRLTKVYRGLSAPLRAGGGR